MKGDLFTNRNELPLIGSSDCYIERHVTTRKSVVASNNLIANEIEGAGTEQRVCVR
jgi:hypothetical protein